MYAFDTTPDPGAKSSISIPRNGTVRIDAKFRQALNETVNLMIIGSYDTFIEIDEHNNVLYGY